MAKSKKEPVNTELVTTAIGISSELRQIVEQIEANGGECDDATFAALQGWQAALEVKAESIAHVKLRLEADAAYWQQYEDAARAKRKSKEAAVKRLTDYLALCMVTAGVKSIKRDDGLFSISLQQGRASCVVHNEKKLPFELVDIVELIKPRTAEIKERLEAGEEVPGATLEYGANFVTIRLSGNKSSKETSNDC